MMFQVKALLILCVVLMGTLAVSKATARSLLVEANNPVNVSQVFENWMKEHGRTYSSSEEKAKRFAIFKEAFDELQSFNNQGNHSFTLGLNAFSDISYEEFEKSYGCTMDIPSSVSSSRYLDFKLEDLPKNWDWRTQRAVTSVKDQGDCDCGWAFATAAAVEGLTQLFNKTYGKLMNVSLEKLIAGSESYGTRGFEEIEGAKTTIRGAMTYVKEHGLETEEKFPYNFESLPPPDMKISGYEVVPEFDEAALLKAVYHQPVVVVHSVSEVFLKHRVGMFMDVDGECGRRNITHTSTLVGFGTNSFGMDYWILKNSWGPSWGEHGFARIRRNTENKRGVCNLAAFPVFPTV